MIEPSNKYAAMGSVLLGILAAQGCTAAEALVVFDLALRLGRSEVPPADALAAEHCVDTMIAALPKPS